MDDLKQDNQDTKRVPAEALRAAGLAPTPGSALLPCPFCGSEARYVNTKDGGCCIECTQYPCMASSKLVYPDKTDPVTILAEAWNTRVADCCQGSLPPPPKKGWNHSEMVLVYYAADHESDQTAKWSIAYYHYNPPYEEPCWVDFNAQGRGTPDWWWPLPKLPNDET